MKQRIQARFLLIVLLLGGFLAPVLHRYQHDQQIWSAGGEIVVAHQAADIQSPLMRPTVRMDVEECLLCTFVLIGVPAVSSGLSPAYVPIATARHIALGVVVSPLAYTSIRGPSSSIVT